MKPLARMKVIYHIGIEQGETQRGMSMRKIMMLLLAGAVFAVSQMAFADDFMPRKLEITGSETAYATSVLQGNPVKIPVSVSGGDATIYLAVFTKDRSRFIQNIETVSLSWRYVNNIDTCIYVSPPYHLAEGEHVIEWDGATPDGTPLSAGEYYYYLWGIDTDSEKQLVSSDIPFPKTGGIIQTHDYRGSPVDRPLFYPNADVYSTGTDSVTVTRNRWPIGADPLDADAIEQTWYWGAPNWAERGPLSISPYMPDQFYVAGYDLLENYGSMRRFHWVTDGVAVWDKSWGTDDGEVRYPSVYPGQLPRDPGAVYIGSDDLLSATYIGTDESFISSLTAIDGIDGYIHYTIEPQSWWVALNSPESQPLVESMSFREVHGMQSLIIGNHLGSLLNVINPQDNDGDWLRYGTELPPQTVSGHGNARYRSTWIRFIARNWRKCRDGRLDFGCGNGWDYCHSLMRMVSCIPLFRWSMNHRMTVYISMLLMRARWVGVYGIVVTPRSEDCSIQRV